MSKRHQNRQKDKSTVSVSQNPSSSSPKNDKRFSRWSMLMFAVGVSALLFVGWIIYKRINAPSGPPVPREELSWPVEKVTASPENTKQFIEARLEFIADRLPDDLRHPLIGNRPVKKFFKDFLASGKMDECVKIIHAGRSAALNGKRSLTLLPDTHASVLSGQNEESRLQQKKIATYLRTAQPKLVFAENLGCELTWENLYQELLQTGERQLQKKIDFSLEEFKEWRREKDTTSYWWSDFIDAPPFPIVGIDKHMQINTIVLLLSDLERSSILKGTSENTAQWLNHSIRDQLLLAIMIMEMERRGINEATVVIGALHDQPMTHFCKEWGIHLKVVQP